MAFGRALGSWRAGGERALSCPACGERRALEQLRYRPPAAFGRVALELAEVEAPSPDPVVMAWLTDRWGGVRRVLRRV